jgi:hypothetical protein
MTGQQVFNKVAKHLMKQGEKAEAVVANGMVSCQYLTPEGAKCAIGCLIPKRRYLPTFEGEAVWSAGGAKILRAAGLRKNQLKLAEALQQVHDSYVPSEWKQKLQAVATRFKFTLPKELR